VKKAGWAVMLGCPAFWRTLRRDAVTDVKLHEVLAQADILSPWTIGRYNSPESAERHVEKEAKPDMQWCAQHQQDYLPVIFPGFSWHNMHGGESNAIPRRKGEFFWRQARAHIAAGASMIYVAMFDEVDEGTAIFKCTNEPPQAGGATFVTYEGLPSDHYLKLTGQVGKLLRGESQP
jgi:hypothetical protein